MVQVSGARAFVPLMFLGIVHCTDAAPTAWRGSASAGAPQTDRATARDASVYQRARQQMVDEQIAARGVEDPRVIAAMRAVPRHAFVPPRWRSLAYADRALPIDEKQTISQPYVVAVMTELARLVPDSRVLEVGSGSGYQAAVLAELSGEVYSIEIVEALAHAAARTLAGLGYGSVRVRHGDGYRGWPAVAPFDAILVTAAAPRVPPALLEQLAPGGRLVIPVGEGQRQYLEVHERRPGGIAVKRHFPVLFVPMTGEVREAPR